MTDQSKLERHYFISYSHKKNDAIDRLANYNTPNGWECWEPE